MAGLVNIGFGNLVNAQKVAAVVNPDVLRVHPKLLTLCFGSARGLFQSQF